MVEIDKNLKIQLQECNSNYILGVLSTNTEKFPNIGENRNESVTLTRTGYNICFFVEPISFQPEPINELDNYLNHSTYFSTLYIGFEESFTKNLLPLDFAYTTDYESKLQKIKESLEGKIIVFRPKVTFTNDGKIFKNMDIVSLEEPYKGSSTDYTPIPIINEIEKFEESLKESQSTIFKDFYHNMVQPDYVFCDDYLYSFKGGWKKASSGKKNGWLYTTPEEILKIKIDASKWREHQVVASPNSLVFVNTKYLIDLHQEFSKNGIEINFEKIKNQRNDTNTFSNEGSHENFDSNNSNSHTSNNTDSQKLEQQFLSDLQKYARRKKLFYEKEDLINFHISVKTNPITILSGMSGTGKSQLALMYAKTLGLSKEEGTLLVLPISPSYTEPEDLIGFHNSSTGLYMPSETGLVDFLIHAKNNDNKMHMIIFDEMNLSQVEYWFAPFISLLEIEEASYRELKLWSKDAVCHNSVKYPSSINIANNIIFIGTANMDETTKDFSDRLLDRANIVTPRKMKFTSLQKSLDDSNENYQIKEEFVELYRTRYRTWSFNENPWSAFSEKELEFFDILHEKIQKYDQQKGVSFRALEKIGMYLNNIPKDENGNLTMNREDAIDLQVKQRILTKIRGSSEKIGDLIGSLSSNDGVPQNSELYDIFLSEDLASLSHFNLSIIEIKRKARELYINDYAS